MAKRARRRRRGFRGFAGLGNLRRPGLAREVVPPVVGGVLAILGIRSFVRPDTAAMAKLYEHAPLAGIGVAALGGGAMYVLTKSKAPAISATLAGLAVGGGVWASELLNAQRAAAAGALPAGGTAGLGALVPETMRGVVMEPVQGLGAMYGETVQLSGVVNPTAFGRETYKS